jgi:hypothetical protein
VACKTVIESSIAFNVCLFSMKHTGAITYFIHRVSIISFNLYHIYSHKEITLLKLKKYSNQIEKTRMVPTKQYNTPLSLYF